MSLAEEIAQRKAQQRADAARRADPELEARLDRFIAENPQIVERLRAMSREELVEKLMAGKMERAEAIAARNRELEPWIKEHPEIVERVEQRMRLLMAERQSVVSKIAGTETVNRPHGPRIRI